MAKQRRQPVKAYGRLIGYGSTRYSAKGSGKTLARTRTVGTRLGGGMVGSMVGANLGGVVGGAHGAAAGSVVGAVGGMYGGMRASAHLGTVRRTKQRMTLRDLNSNYGKPDKHFHASRHHHTQGGMTH